MSRLEQLCFSQWIKYWSSPRVSFWSPGQRGFGSLGHVVLIIEGGHSQEGKQKYTMAPEIYNWKRHPAIAVPIPLAKGSYVVKDNFRRTHTPPMRRGREEKGAGGIWARKLSNPPQ